MSIQEELLHALAFAAAKHRDQRRKDAEATPYLNHVIDVARILAAEGGVADSSLLVAAILHDTVEDTETTHAELERVFGKELSALVAEVTDDPELHGNAQKQHQVDRAPRSSAAAKQLKIADKTANVRDVDRSPPAHWSLERRLEYLDWAERVVAGCRGVNAGLEEAFDQLLAAARASLRGRPD